MKTKKTFHIVCEGNTDFEIIRVLIDALGNNNQCNYSAKPLFPPRKTTNAGWPNLKGWCIKQASLLAGTRHAEAMIASQLLGAKANPGAQKRQADNISAALLLNDADATTAIIIQMDADIAHDLLSDIDAPKNVPFLPLCPQERLRICEAAIDKWLGAHVEKKGSSIYYCVTTLAIENWILTMHDEETLGVAIGTGYDTIHSPEKILSALGYPNKNGKMKKDPPKYERYGQQLAKVLPKSVQRSKSLHKFCETVLGA